MSGKHERFTTAVNDSTGDLIKTKASGQDKYAKGWEAIFGKKEAGKLTQEDVVVSVETPNGKVIVEGYVSPHPLLGLGTKLGLEYGDGLEYQEMVREGILSQSVFEEEGPTLLAFTEQLLPSGIIEDEV